MIKNLEFIRGTRYKQFIVKIMRCASLAFSIFGVIYYYNLVAAILISDTRFMKVINKEVGRHVD